MLRTDLESFVVGLTEFQNTQIELNKFRHIFLETKKLFTAPNIPIAYFLKCFIEDNIFLV
jgi:hypothetical protein